VGGSPDNDCFVRATARLDRWPYEVYEVMRVRGSGREMIMDIWERMLWN